MADERSRYSSSQAAQQRNLVNCSGRSADTQTTQGRPFLNYSGPHSVRRHILNLEALSYKSRDHAIAGDEILAEFPFTFISFPSVTSQRIEIWDRHVQGATRS